MQNNCANVKLHFAAKHKVMKLPTVTEMQNAVSNYSTAQSETLEMANSSALEEGEKDKKRINFASEHVRRVIPSQKHKFPQVVGHGGQELHKIF